MTIAKPYHSFTPVPCAPPSDLAAQVMQAPAATSSGAGTRVAPGYTHEQHAQRCAEAARQGVPLRQYVQIQIGRQSCCAYLLDAWTTADGVDLWKLEMIEPNEGHVTHRNTRVVRQCSGIDGRCVCAGETQ